LGIEDSTGIIPGNFQDGGISSFGENDLHFLGRLVEDVLDDLESDRVGQPISVCVAIHS
jgi:hypothetical protein